MFIPYKSGECTIFGGFTSLDFLTIGGMFFFFQDYYILYAFEISNSGKCIIRWCSSTRPHFCTWCISFSYNLLYYCMSIWNYYFFSLSLMFILFYVSAAFAFNRNTIYIYVDTVIVSLGMHLCSGSR